MAPSLLGPLRTFFGRSGSPVVSHRAIFPAIFLILSLAGWSETARPPRTLILAKSFIIGPLINSRASFPFLSLQACLDALREFARRNEWDKDLSIDVSVAANSVGSSYNGKWRRMIRSSSFGELAAFCRRPQQLDNSFAHVCCCVCVCVCVCLLLCTAKVMPRYAFLRVRFFM